MADVLIEGGTLTASRADRIVAGMLLPYGELGRTNLGRFEVPRGAFELPADPAVMTLNLQHDSQEPLGRAVSLTDTNAGVLTAFQIAKTPEGDAYLDEVGAGKRNSLSAEVKGVVIRSGKAVAGRLYAAAAVTAGAFPSATLMAADTGAVDPATIEAAKALLVQIASQLDVTDGAVPADQMPPEGDVTTAEAPAVEQTVPTDQAQAPDPLKAALPGSLGGGAKTTPATLFASLAGKSLPEAATMLAALDVINQADGAPAVQNQWLGEVYGSRTYARRFASLIQHADLAGLKAIGWKFTTGKTPVVAPYTAGQQPNSNEVKTEQVTLDALRLAAAGEVDRAFIDFPVPEFWAGYFREQTNSYERVLDGIVHDALVAGATAVVAGAVPAAVSEAAAKIVDGAMAVINAERGLPSFAIVGSDLYRDLLLTRADDVVAFLNAALGLEEGSLANFRIVPSARAGVAGKVLVGANTAATLFELPGAPVRVDTVAIASGAVDRGLFGYHAALINDSASLALVSTGA